MDIKYVMHENAGMNNKKKSWKLYIFHAIDMCTSK